MIAEQKGFAIINLLVVVALTAIIAIGAGMSTVQVLGVTEKNEELNIAIRNAQNTGYRISQDLLTAETVTSGDDVSTPEVEFMTIFAKDWESGYTYETRYIWLNPADTRKDVIRKQKVCDENGGQISNVSTLVAKNVSSVSMTGLGNVTQVTIQAQSQTKNIAREYYIVKRLGQGYE